MKITPRNTSTSTWIYYLLTVYFLSSVLFFQKLADPTLLPRFICLSFLLLLLLAWHVWRQDSERPVIPLSSPVIGTGALTIVYALSCPFAGILPEAIFETQRMFLFFMLVTCSTLALRSSPSFLKHFIILTLMVGSVAILVGTVQLFSLKSLRFGALYTVKGITQGKNLFSAYLYLLLVFSLTGIFTLSNFWKPFARLISVLYVIMILILQTRATWMGLMVAVSIGSTIAITKVGVDLKKYVLTATIVIILLLGMIWVFKDKPFAHRLTFWDYANTGSGKERLVVWEKTICMMDRHWVWGIGAGQWQFNFTKCSWNGLEKPIRDNFTFQRPHNDPLWVLAETGVVGFAVYLFIFLTPLITGFVFVARNELTRCIPVLVLTSGLVGFMALSFFDFPKERVEHLILSANLLVFLFNTSTGTTVIKWKIRLRKIALPLILILLSNCFIGYYRWKGEYYGQRMKDQMKNRNYANVLLNAGKAYSIFYTIDNTSMPIRWYQGVSLFFLNKGDLGLAYSEEAYRSSPFHPKIVGNLGSIYYKNGNRIKAKKLFEEALNLSSTYEYAKLNLATILFNEGDYTEAYRLVKTIKYDTVIRNQYLRIIGSKVKIQY